VNAWKVILATLVIFGAGVVTGALVVRHSQQAPWRRPLVHQQQPQVAPQPGEPPPRATNRLFNAPAGLSPLMRKDLLKNLDRELALTEKQRDNIEKALTDGQERTKKLWEKVAPQMREEWMLVKNEIEAQLTDEQKTKFNDLMKRPRKQDDRKPEERRPPGSREDLPPKEPPPQSLQGSGK
jgi:hypothetical protein